MIITCKTDGANDYAFKSFSKILYLLVVIVILYPDIVRAGGIAIKRESVTLNGVTLNGANFTQQPTQISSSLLHVCFSMSYYLFSSADVRGEFVALGITTKSTGGMTHRRPGKFVQATALALMKRDPQSEQSLTGCVDFNAVGIGGYELHYSPLPIFVQHARSRGDYFPSSESLKSHLRDESQTLGSFLVVNNDDHGVTGYKTYLHLNGQVPELGTKLRGGVFLEPAHFTWESRPSSPGIEYRFRVYPDEVEWSPWSKQNSWDLYFAATGGHVLQVSIRIKNAGGVISMLPQLEYSFTLERPFLAAPPKAALRAEKRAPENSVEQSINLYRHSRALVIGIIDFSDLSFPKLAYVKNDADKITAALEALHFDVARPRATSRLDVLNAIDKLIRESGEDDRLVIYISSHGFADPENPASGYIASSDCRRNAPFSCIALREIEEHVVTLSAARRVRHLLIIVDACSAGLGALTKSGGFPERGIVTHSGVHFFGAGTAEEEARATKDGQMSVFTRYLVEALQGGANSQYEGALSLSELVLYVRWKVAVETDGSQTPMLGRLSGSGEMIFPGNFHVHH